MKFTVGIAALVVFSVTAIAANLPAPKVTEEYDKFKDSTTVGIHLQPSGAWDITIYYTFKGKTSEKPKAFKVKLISSSASGATIYAKHRNALKVEFAGDKDLSRSYDAKYVNVERGDNGTAVVNGEAVPVADTVKEEMDFSIPADDLVKFANSKTLQFRVSRSDDVKIENGYEPRELPAAYLAAMNQLAIRSGVKDKAAEVDAGGNTELHRLILAGKMDQAKTKISASTVNVANKYGLAPLHMAVSRGDMAMIKALVEAGADVNPATSLRTPLKIALEAKNDEIANYLKEKGTKETAASQPTAPKQ